MTPRQKQTLDFFIAYTAEHRRPPSYREIGAGIGAKSMATIHRCVKELVSQGRLVQRVGRVRALQLPEPRGGAPEIDAIRTVLKLYADGRLPAERTLALIGRLAA